MENILEVHVFIHLFTKSTKIDYLLCVCQILYIQNIPLIYVLDEQSLVYLKEKKEQVVFLIKLF